MSDKKRIVVWGTGYYGHRFDKLLKEYYGDFGYEIIGYTNSYDVDDKSLAPFIKHENLENSTDYDLIVVAANQKNEREIISFLIEKKIDSERIVSWEKMINSLRRDKILRKSLDHEYDDICVTIEWLKNNELTVRNNFENNEQTVYPVFVDKETGFPYVTFNGYRMYYPVDTMFSIGDDGKSYLYNVAEGDQYTGSPHLYVFGEHRVNEGDVIVDGGVAEGNFFLSYIDKVKKAYLFEGDSRWLEALKLTIRPFKDKIVLIPKYLSDVDNDMYTTLDSSISEKIDFLKMDIEGYEVRALLGGINVLTSSDAKLSICAYHRQYDSKYIEFILNAMGYRVSRSNGCMFFLYDEDIDRSLDFRNGVLYGDKEKCFD